MISISVLSPMKDKRNLGATGNAIRVESNVKS